MSKSPINLSIEESLKRRLKAACAMQGRDVSSVVSELVEEWLEKIEPQLVQQAFQKENNKN
ncbi:hypothetical protein H6S82_13605 [Planktothrix sp. FACHB-1355]|uniref:Uncharacterized protein n=1 Tax=Aerosakkonema funiforme FACHB-1375 TaxID=2949571 RepID=A0A926VK06_9CYAN|nr:MULTISPECIES: plasmid partition protein ParG [Oscillatoriales]MBD2185113.1 hypothetical protein [Aerosakkonema funiforme FACHB-1375]MBD3559890.1 hypothetical protein [Planktothrix sp. FACHB-1355]